MRRIVFFLCTLCTFALAGQQLDSLKNALTDATGAHRIDILHQLCIGLWLNNPNEAMTYVDEALALSQETKDSTNIVKSYRLKGGVYYYQGDFESSQEYDEFALELSIQLKDSVLINSAYNNVGLLQYNMGNYQTAFEFFLRSRKIKLAIGETYGLATTVNNMGLVFERVGNFETARKYFEEAHQIAVATNNIALRIYSKNNMGTTYLRQGNLDRAMPYFRQALALALAEGNVNYGAVAMRRIGEVFKKQGAYDSALVYYSKSRKESESINDRRGMSELLYLMARLHAEKGDINQALAYLDQSHEIAMDLKLRQQLLDNLKLYATIYRSAKNFENSFTFLQSYINLSDSLFVEVIQRNLALIPVKLQEEEDRLLLAKQEIELQRRDSTNRMYVIILIISACFVVFLGYLVRRNILANRVLSASNDELKRTQNLLITSEKMASLGLLAAGIGHEINNPLNFIKNGSLELAKQLKEGKKSLDELQPYFHAIDEGVYRASVIVKSLSHFSRKEADLYERCDLQEILENCLVILNNNIQPKAEVVRTYSGRAKIRGIQGKLHQAFLNILSNAEQAIEKKGTIHVKTEVVGANIRVTISDTGAGIPAENLAKISDPFFTTKDPGVGVGLGLFVVYSIIEEHKGTIHIDSEEGKGTQVEIELPI